MIVMLERSLVGCSAAMAADVADHGSGDRQEYIRNWQARKRRGVPPRTRSMPEPKPQDDAAGLCGECGYRHPEPAMSCVQTLRARLSRYE